MVYLLLCVGGCGGRGYRVGSPRCAYFYCGFDVSKALRSWRFFGAVRSYPPTHAGRIAAGVARLLCMTFALGCTGPDSAATELSSAARGDAATQLCAKSGRNPRPADMEQYCSLVEDLDRANTHLTALVPELWRDTTYSLRDMESSVDAFLSRAEEDREFLYPFSNDRDVVRGFLLNVLTMRDHFRKDKRPYPIHPGRLAVFLGHLSTRLPDTELLKRAAVLNQIHDVSEELVRMYDLGLRTNTWLKDYEQAIAHDQAVPPGALGEYDRTGPVKYFRDRTARMFDYPDAQRDQLDHVADDVLVLMAPYLDYAAMAAQLATTSDSTKPAFIAKNVTLGELVRLRESFSVVIVEIIDRLDWLFDLEYLFLQESHNPESRSQKLADQVARSVWTLQHMVDGAYVGAESLPTEVRPSANLPTKMRAAELEQATQWFLQMASTRLRDEPARRIVREGCGQTQFGPKVSAIIGQFQRAARHNGNQDITHAWLESYFLPMYPDASSLSSILDSLPEW
jgi:hypothetical protein